MNKWLMHKVLRAKYRKYALRISVVVHVIMIIVYALFFIQTEVSVIEDEMEIEFIKELPRITKKQPMPILKKEIPKPKVEMPTLEKRTIRKQVNVVKPEQSVEIKKMDTPARAGGGMQSPAPKNIDVNPPELSETPNLSTDAKLTASAESILSSTASDIGDTLTKSYSRRKGTGVKSPGKGKGIGKGLNMRGTGTGTGTADGVAEIGAGVGGGGSLFGNTIKSIAEDIIGKSAGAPIDVVFVVDTSGSMVDNIKAVPQHLGQMIDVYEASESDYALGLTLFTTIGNGENYIEVHPLTTNVDYIKHPLYAIQAGGGQNLLDAIDETVKKMRFRKNTIKHLILVSDEQQLTSRQGLTAHQVIQQCQKKQIHVNVLGVDNQDHKRLARETGGIWHAVPEDTIVQKTPTPISSPRTTQTISKVILKDAASMPVDIILFIDGSKSMEDKMPYLKQQIDFWIRDWDIALIDYRLGVVRFRAKQGVNMVNVYKPPQTQEKIHSILKLPYSDDENLLQAITDATRRLKIRAKAKTHFIFITDEPGDPKFSIAGTIGYLKDIPVVVSVIGTSDKFQQQVAIQTGGVYVKMPNAHKINSRYE